MLSLHIQLKSGLCCGSGSGRAGFVDREVSLDPHGLPYIPGRSLKGLLRDAYRDLPAKLVPGLPPPDSLFGNPGEENSGSLRIGSARVTGFEALSSWLHDVARDDRLRDTIRRDDVIDCYTEIRRQTSMDRESGAPLTDTLRATRVVRAGLKLEAAVDIAEEYRSALALAAAAVKQIGSSRNRGFGEVECSLWDGANITAPAIEQLDKGTLAFAAPKPAETSPQPDKTGSGRRVLGFSIELKEPALFPALEGDANTVLTERFIPGSAIRGMLARRWLRRYSYGPQFERLFLGGVQFLNAVPETLEKKRALPVPHSVREDKDIAGEFYDLCAPLSPGTQRTPLRRVRGWVANVNPAGSKLLDAETSLHYHHARAADPRAARAIGQENAVAYGLEADEAGALFVYESLTPRNRFRGALIGSEEDLKVLRGLQDENTPATLGRSTSAQYGGAAVWTWDRAAHEIKDQSDASPSADIDEGYSFQIVLLSPMVSRNANGLPAACLPVDDLAKSLGGVQLKSIAAFARVETFGGYLSHQRLPRIQGPALAAGSVFVFEADRDISKDSIDSTTARSWGMRTEDGFGRLSIRRQPTAWNLRMTAAMPNPVTVRAFDAQTHGDVRELAQKIFRKRVEQRAVMAALEQAKRPEYASISNHLLSRIGSIVAVTPCADLIDRLDKLRDRAKTQLGELLTLLRDASNWQRQYQKFVNAELGSAQQAGGAPRRWPVLFGTAGPGLAPDEAVVRSYLLRLLAGIAREKRKSA